MYITLEAAIESALRKGHYDRNTYNACPIQFLQLHNRMTYIVYYFSISFYETSSRNDIT